MLKWPKNRSKDQIRQSPVTETNHTLMEVTMAEYDPQIIRKLAGRLYRRARTVGAMSTVPFFAIWLWTVVVPGLGDGPHLTLAV